MSKRWVTFLDHIVSGLPPLISSKNVTKKSYFANKSWCIHICIRCYFSPGSNQIYIHTTLQLWGMPWNLRQTSVLSKLLIEIFIFTKSLIYQEKHESSSSNQVISVLNSMTDIGDSVQCLSLSDIYWNWLQKLFLNSSINAAQFSNKLQFLLALKSNIQSVFHSQSVMRILCCLTTWMLHLKS